MLAVYDEKGHVNHVVFDPVPEGSEEDMINRGLNVISFQGTQEDVFRLMARCYVSEGEIYDRPSFVAPDVLDLKVSEKARIDVPKGTEIRIDGETFISDDGVIEIESDMPASYRMLLTNWPYQEHQITVNVHEA